MCGAVMVEGVGKGALDVKRDTRISDRFRLIGRFVRSMHWEDSRLSELEDKDGS